MASVIRHLQVGQKISLTELETGWGMAVVDGAEGGLTVVEASPEFLVLEDATGDVRKRIPGYLVRSVTGATEPVVAAEVEPVAVVAEEAPALVPELVEEHMEVQTDEPVPSVEVPAVVVSEAA